MTVTVYVDVQDNEVYSEKEYKAAIQQMVEDVCNDCENDYCWSFDAWMDDEGYTPFEIFNFSEEEKKAVARQYREYAYNAIRSYWDCEEREIEI